MTRRLEWSSHGWATDGRSCPSDTCAQIRRHPLFSKVFPNPAEVRLIGGTMTVNQLVPVAQYLRMSTEHQQYSLENQSTAIQKYAESHSFEVVRTYSDTAKSGLVLRRRAGHTI